MDVDLEELRTHYSKDTATFADLVLTLDTHIQSALSTLGIRCSVSSRSKDVGSILKNVMIGRYPDPYAQIADRAGIRIIVPYEDCISQVETVIKQMFPNSTRSDKAEYLSDTRLGYRGIHYIVTITKESILGHRKDFRDRLGEIQIHTKAQSLWSTMSHDLLYKPALDLSLEYSRALNRLQVLTELFDSEVSRVRSVMMTPEFDCARVLETLERIFLRVCTRPFNRELSFEVIDAVLPLFQEPRADGAAAATEKFVDAHEEKIRHIYNQYTADKRHVLLFQPEALLLFERLDTTPAMLTRRWGEHNLPETFLQELADVWGAQTY